MLDVTDDASIARAAATAGDTTLLVANAGVSTFARLTDGTEEDIRLETETNFLATLRWCAPSRRSWAPTAAVPC
ncbi:hypothetical protein [Streptomyces carpinensis]|uniref:Uncharacterized protein n=1 Tax=Streptomyces carpinensis TaxID=66369 RepID=A0ABV1WH43_9ACTN